MDSVRPTREQLEREVDDLRRQLAGETPRKEHGLAQTYLDLAGVMFVALDAAGTLTLVNRKACEVLGYTEEQIVGRNWFDTCLPQRLRETVKDVSKRLLRGEIEPTEYYENPILTKSGDERIIAWHNTVLRDDEGAIIGHLSSGEDITDRRAAEERIHRLSSVVEQSTEGMALADLDGNLIFVNLAWARMHGYESSDELLGQNLSIFHNQEQLDREVAPFNRKVMEEDHHAGEVGHMRKDGATFPTLMVTTLLRDDRGKPVALAGIAKDITERKRSEEALRTSEDNYRTLVSHTPAVLWTSDRDGHTSFISSNVEQVYGYTPKEILEAGDRLWLGRIHPEDLASVKAAYAAMIDRGEPFDIEYRIQRQDGDWIWLRDRATRSHEIDGALRVDGVFLDVTDRKLAEEELHQYEHIVSSATDMLALVDQRYVYLAANAAYLQAFAKTSDEVIGRTVAEVFGEEFFTTVIKPRAERCLAGEHIRYQDWFDFPVTGRKYMDIAYSPYLGPDTEPRGFVVSGRDITDRKQAEEERDHLEAQLRQAQKMEAIGQLAGGIAHDFNNILTAIMGNAELLKMDLPAEGKQATFTDEIIRGAARAADLTRQLLAFARKGKRQVTPVDVHNIVHQTVKMLTHSIDKRIEIHLELHASASTVMGDPTQLQNAMLNLGVNARDAMGDGGVLTYATRDVTLSKTECDKHPYELTPGSFLEIRITDTGVGMDQQTQKRVFEPFFTTKEVGKGTGLGLAGVYGCVRSHDGSVSVSSKPGQGATFTILLPLTDTSASATERTVSSDEPVRGTGHVLVVDDEESIRNFVRTSLQNLGYTVSVCSNGAAGVDYYREHHQEIDLVILDLIMPRMNGQDTFGEVKKINANVRVLVSSGFTHTQATYQMLDEGVLALLNKPFQITELSEAVARHIQYNSPQ